MTDSEHIIQFFIDIFILQSSPPDVGNWEGEYELMSSGSQDDGTYELRIRRGCELKTRRMSIRQIGDIAESKSTCYMVTYDDFLVIKIPPVPLSDFDRYLDDIEVEKQISDRLNPKVTSLAPGLSPILCRIPEIFKKLNQNKDISEEEYIRLLKKEPQYQRFLKIDGQFVFFMELSQYVFFDQIIKKIHCEKDRISDEIIKYSHVFDDLVAFESVYGSDNDALFFRVNELNKCFYLKLEDLLSRSSNTSVVPEYEKREWLFAALADKHPEIDRHASVAVCSDKISQLLSQVITENPETVEEYYGLVRSSVRRRIFDHHRANIETLIIKMLALLYQLNYLGIAIRDLKPDNMLVAGKSDGHEAYLADPDAYDLGLIDLETAIHFQGSELTRQPLLSGTPSYMTPSHLFSNRILIAVFEKKMPDVFYLQDWFAAMGIIFCIATGQRLFEKTAKLIPEIVRAKKRGIVKNNPEADILKNVSRVFWKTAADEFSERIQINRQRLEEIQLSLPEHITDLFFSEARREKSLIQDAIEQCANSQKLFPRQARKLISAPVDAIRIQRIKWENNDPKQNVPPDVHREIIVLLNRLETLKSQLINFDENCRLIKPSLSCEALLTFMFNQVALAMNCV